MVILVAVVLLVVGPAKAPSIARSLGRGVREVRETVDGTQREIKEAVVGSDKPADGTSRPS